MITLSEYMPPEFDYVSDVAVQTSILRTYTDKVEAQGELAMGKPIVFIPSVSPAYTQLYRTWLQVTCKVTRENGNSCVHTAPAAGSNAAQDKVCVANNLLHTMFSKLKINVNGKTVETLDNYPYLAYIQDLTTPKHLVRNRQAALTGWSKDTFNAFAHSEMGAGNTGMDSRSTEFKSSAPVTLLGKLHSNLFDQGLCLPPDAELRIELHPSEHKFALMAKTGSKYELHITNVALWVERKEVKPALSEAHTRIFSTLPENQLTMPIIEKGVVESGVAAGQKVKTLSLFKNETLPDSILIAFLSNESYTGDINANPFNFQHYKVKKLYAMVNGDAIPADAYEPTWDSTSGYKREYHALLDQFNALESDKLDITLPEFGGGYTLFPFQITPSAGALLGPQRVGELTVKVEFAEVLAAAINVLVFYTRRNTIQVPTVKKTG